MIPAPLLASGWAGSFGGVGEDGRGPIRLCKTDFTVQTVTNAGQGTTETAKTWQPVIPAGFLQVNDVIELLWSEVYSRDVTGVGINHRLCANATFAGGGVVLAASGSISQSSATNRRRLMRWLALVTAVGAAGALEVLGTIQHPGDGSASSNNRGWNTGSSSSAGETATVTIDTTAAITLLRTTEYSVNTGTNSDVYRGKVLTVMGQR